MADSPHKTFLLLAVLVGGISGCGDDGSIKSAPPLALEWKGASESVVVATVAGEPVHGECVAGRVARSGVSREQALTECIDFELLAQEARKRGLGDAEVDDVRRREAVRRLLDNKFYATFQTWQDVPIDDVRKLWDRGLRDFYNRPETRSTYYCRAENRAANGLTPDGPPSVKAKAVADAIYAEVRDRVDLTEEQLKLICKRLGTEMIEADVSVGRFGTPRYGRADEDYAAATFAVEAAGRVSPPSRTKWGWDIILVTDILPAASHSFDEATPLIKQRLFLEPEFEGYRRQKFRAYLDAVAVGVDVERYDDVLGVASSHQPREAAP